MITKLIHNLYNYNAWANACILDTAAQLDSHQLYVEARTSFGSVHATLVHIMNAQCTWLARWQDTSSMAIGPQNFPDLDVLRTRWDQIERETQSFVAACREADFERIIAYDNLQGERWAYPLWQQMLHQVNHATQHRSEVAMILSEWGYSPGWLDLLYFVDLQSPGE